MRIYLKIFVFCGVFYGLAMSLWFSLFAGIKLGMLVGCCTGLAFGFLMSALLGTAHHLSRRHHRITAQEDSMGVRPVNVVTLQESQFVAFRTCVDIIASMRNWQITELDSDAALITVKTSLSWASFGEIVTLSVSAGDGTCSQVTVCSRPAVSTTLIDYGKNALNVRQVIGALKKYASDSQALIAQFREEDTATDVVIETEPHAQPLL